MKRRFGLRVPLPVIYGMLLITASIWCMPDSTQAVAQFTLTVSKDGTGSGTVTSSPAGLTCDSACIAVSATFDQGTRVTLTASATNNSRFTGWSGEGCSGTGTCTVNILQASNVRAIFAPPQFTLTVSKGGTGSGTVTSSPAGLTCDSTCLTVSTAFDQGTRVTLTASAANGSHFTGWSGEGCSGTSTCTLSMTQARNVSATFIPFAAPVIEHPTDFDGDRKSDILWHHAQTGDVVVWLMNGTTMAGAAVVAQVSDLGWQIMGVGDVDGDGKADLVWRHSQTGEVYVWLMNGLTLQRAGSLLTVSDLGWQIMGVGDVDGDGKADLVWRHTQTGMVVVWRLDGLSVLEVRPIATVDDLGWQIQ